MKYTNTNRSMLKLFIKKINLEDFAYTVKYKKFNAIMNLNTKMDISY